MLGAIPVVAALVLWWSLTAGPVENRRIGPSILPNPVEVFSPQDSVIPLVRDRNLTRHILISLRRVSLSYVVALAVAFPLGVLMGSFRNMRAVFAPSTTASGYVPIATLVPLTMSWFGTGEVQKVVFLSLAFAVYLLPAIIAAIDSVDDVYIRTASTLGGSRWQIIRYVLVPIAMPDIWHSMRLAFGVGWTYLVLAEVVVLADGLGYLISMSQRRGPREHIYLVILVITLVAWVSDLLWSRLGRVLFRHRGAA